MPSRLSGPALSTTNLPRFELPALDFDFGRITDGTNIPPPPSSPVVQKVPTPPQTPPAEKKDPLVHEEEPVDQADPVDRKQSASHQEPTEPDKPVGLNEPVDHDEPHNPANGADHHLSTPPNGNAAGPKRYEDDVPLSPADSGRQGSLRRLFSRNMLNDADAEGRSMSLGASSMLTSTRPESRGTTIVADDRRRKRASGWFRRLRGGDPKRSTIYFDETAQVTVVPIKAPDLSPKTSEVHQPVSIPPPPPPPAGPPPPMIPELIQLENNGAILGNDLFKNIK